MFWLIKYYLCIQNHLFKKVNYILCCMIEYYLLIRAICQRFCNRPGKNPKDFERRPNDGEKGAFRQYHFT